MAAIVSIVAGTASVDNTQKRGVLHCQLQVTGTPYPVGGIPLDSVLLASGLVNTNSGIKFTLLQSEFGTGYMYQRIPSTGKMMILQVPANGSLTTAAPLQEIPSSLNLQGIQNDRISCRAEFLRNS